MVRAIDVALVGLAFLIYILVISPILTTYTATYFDLREEIQSRQLWDTTWSLDEEVDTSITPFTLQVNEKKLKFLKASLKEFVSRKPNYPELTEDKDWHFGIPSNFVHVMAKYWLEEYDWRAREKVLNDVGPQFHTKINGLQIHFYHAKV